MRDLDTDGKYTWRYQIVAMARDVLTICATISVLGGILWVFVSPYLEPFIELPEKVAQINARLAPLAQPHLVEFEGQGLIISDKVVKRGGNIRILYHLRRNGDCETEVDLSFLNVDTGARISVGSTRAVQAPVTDDFTTLQTSLLHGIFL